jgi:Fur family ferric uptake transcriptional regulator
MASTDEQAAHVETLRARGLKATPQRLMVIAALTKNPTQHCTAAQVSESAQALYPFMDLSTVYRNLNALVEAGLVTKTDIGLGEAVYEWAGGSAHHHTICRGCGQVEEISPDILDSVATALFEQRQFRADLGHFAIFGTCRFCSQKG